MSTKKIQIVSGSLGTSIYTQNEEPVDATDGSLWVDLDEDGENYNGVTDEQVQNAVNSYLDKNPIESGGLSKSLTSALKTYFTNIQTLLSQLAYTTDNHIGSTLIQNAKDVITALNSEPITPEEPDVPIEPDIDISQNGSILTILGGVTATQAGTVLTIV